MTTGSHTQKALNECPRCRGTGYILYQIDQRELYGSDEPCMIDYASPCPECNGGLEKRSDVIRKRSNIPMAFYSDTLAQFDWTYEQDGKPVNTEPIKKVVQSFVNDFQTWEANGMGLYLHSRTRGSGKTFLASCICNELMKDRALTTKFVRAGDLLDIVKNADKTSPDEYERDPVKLLQRCKLLVLDDIGQKQSGAAWLNDILFQIIDERVNNSAVTLYTSNVPVDQLEIDDRIVSRIYAQVVPLRLPEYSHRSKVSDWKKRNFLKEIGVIHG